MSEKPQYLNPDIKSNGVTNYIHKNRSKLIMNKQASTNYSNKVPPMTFGKRNASTGKS